MGAPSDTTTVDRATRASVDADAKNPERPPIDRRSTGPTIKQVIVDVSGEPFIDLEQEAIALFARE